MFPEIANSPAPPQEPGPQTAQVSAYAPPPSENSSDRLAREIMESREGGQGAPLQPMVISRELSPRSAKAMPVQQPVAQAAPMSAGGLAQVRLPERIPAQCVQDSAAAYSLNPMVLLAILKVESGGRTGVIGKNTNGTLDLGPAQFNTSTWAKKLEREYGIPRDALINNMCQAIRAMAYAVRTEINGVGGNLWRGIGNYHSRTPHFHQIYVGKVHQAHVYMVTKGKFEEEKRR